TYGYFVLEAQSCGCPVITTNIRALPEINNNECGWIIDVPKDDLGNGILKTERDRAFFCNILEQGLEKVLTDIINKPYQISDKGKKALQRIKLLHDPIRHAEQLIAIYQEALE
ncbi:glycosyltransferase, partial [Marinilabiliaceae bacterium ANBcel2]|nr:glycosyltransferase [Marinilabiliaceae bacterium ANBcel2]